METKYYTPTIEEFHLGFDYELYYPNGEYRKEVFGNEIEHPELQEYKDDMMKVAHGIIRVKSLDQEDLESLGWKYNGSGWYDLIKVPGSLGYFTHVKFKFWGKETMIKAYRGEPINCPEEEQQHLFVGEIKNKSELKRIMKQLQIWEQ